MNDKPTIKLQGVLQRLIFQMGGDTVLILSQKEGDVAIIIPQHHRKSAEAFKGKFCEVGKMWDNKETTAGGLKQFMGHAKFTFVKEVKVVNTQKIKTEEAPVPTELTDDLKLTQEQATQIWISAYSISRTIHNEIGGCIFELTNQIARDHVKNIALYVAGGYDVPQQLLKAQNILLEK